MIPSMPSASVYPRAPQAPQMPHALQAPLPRATATGGGAPVAPMQPDPLSLFIARTVPVVESLARTTYQVLKPLVLAAVKAVGQFVQALAGPRPLPGTTLPPAPAPAPNTGPRPLPEGTAVAGPFGQNPDDYVMTFNEEFQTFDTNVWNDTIWYEQSNPTKNYTVEDGKLKIWPQRDADGNFFNRTIDTDGKFYQQYGYFEMEAKLPVGKGTWPAFWLFNHIGDRRPEIDVMEAYAGGVEPWGFTDENGVSRPTAYAPTIWRDQGDQIGSRQYDTGMDLSRDFHKYAVKWEPGKQTFYFDGREVYSVDVEMSDPMYIMTDLWFGSASGTPDDSTPQGKDNSFEVNYIKAWQFKDRTQSPS